MKTTQELNDFFNYILKRYVSDIVDDKLIVYYEDYMYEILAYDKSWELSKYNRVPRNDSMVQWSHVCCLKQNCNELELINIFVDEDKILNESYNDIPSISKEDFDFLIKNSREKRQKEKFEVMKTIPNDDSVVKCLCCEKDIEQSDYGVVSAGYVHIEFGYGSEHDQCKGFGGDRLIMENPTKKDILLACDNIETYICDDCFDKKHNLMKGFVKISKITFERKA